MDPAGCCLVGAGRLATANAVARAPESGGNSRNEADCLRRLLRRRDVRTRSGQRCGAGKQHEASGGYSVSPTCLAIHGATIFSKILPSGHLDDRPMWPPPGLTQASLGDPECSIRSRSAIGTWVSLSPLTSSMGAEARPIRPWSLSDILGPKARNSSSEPAP